MKSSETLERNILRDHNMKLNYTVMWHAKNGLPGVKRKD